MPKEYIDRDHVLKCMEDSYKNAGISAEARAKMTRWLNNAPAADVREVVRATNKSASGFLCSACGFGDFGGFHGYKPNYCPNCGADMKGEDDGT